MCRHTKTLTSLLCICIFVYIFCLIFCHFHDLHKRVTAGIEPMQINRENGQDRGQLIWRLGKQFKCKSRVFLNALDRLRIGAKGTAVFDLAELELERRMGMEK